VDIFAVLIEMAFGCGNRFREMLAHTRVEVSPDLVEKWPVLMALVQVEVTGLK
jgi:hypothetical protein